MAIVSCVNGFCLLLVFASFPNILNAQNDTDTYLGCYKDIGTLQAFEHPYSSQNMTPDHCREYCRSKSLTFAALLGGDRCGCFEQDRLNVFHKLSNSRCDMSCTGDRSRVCGGTKNSDIYSIYFSCPTGKWGNKNCQNDCNCKVGRRCSVQGVCPDKECAPGWKAVTITNRDTCSSDVDECNAECSSTKTADCHNCAAANGEVCNNTAGSFHCICRSGFAEENGKCIDIDECAGNQSRCNQRCMNTVGGYYCSCFAGHELRGIFNCYDINECEVNNPCHHVCINNVGSYACACFDGLYLADDSKTCLTVDKAIPLKIGSGIGLGIQSIIIIILVVTLIIVLKRRTSPGHDNRNAADVVDMKEYASCVVAQDQSDAAYTTIVNLSSENYKNFEPTYDIVPDTT